MCPSGSQRLLCWTFKLTLSKLKSLRNHKEGDKPQCLILSFNQFSTLATALNLADDFFGGLTLPHPGGQRQGPRLHHVWTLSLLVCYPSPAKWFNFICFLDALEKSILICLPFHPSVSVDNSQDKPPPPSPLPPPPWLIYCKVGVLRRRFYHLSKGAGRHLIPRESINENT